MLLLDRQPVEAGDAAVGLRRLAGLAREVDRAVLPQPHLIVPAGAVARDVVEQRPEQRRAQHRLLLGHRVGELHDAVARVVLRDLQALDQRGRGEAPAEDLGQAAADERVLGPAAQALGRLEPAADAAPRGQRGRQLLVAPDAPDLLDEVGLAGDVVAPPVRDRDVEAVVGGRDAEAEPLEDRGLLVARDRGAEQPADARLAQPDDRRRRARPADVDRAAGRPRAAQLDHQLRRERLALHALLGREPLLEAPGGLGAQRRAASRCAGCSARSRSPPPSARAWWCR